MSSERVTYSIGTYFDEPGDLHTWTIRDGDATIASLYVDLETGQIMQIEVNPARQREGLARELYEAAVAQMPIYHSPDEHCTPEGLAFKLAVGGETIDADLAYDPEA